MNHLSYGELGLQYQRDRWSFEARLIAADNDLKRMTGLDVDHPALGISVHYRLY